MSAVPISRRRRGAAMAFGMGLVLLMVGVTPWALPAPIVIRMMATLLGLAGVMFVLGAAGLMRTVRADSRMAAFAGGGCACGHVHDMTETTVLHESTCPSGGACGTGSACASCTLR